MGQLVISAAPETALCRRCRETKPVSEFTPSSLKPRASRWCHSCCPGTKSCGRCIRGLLCQHCNTLLGQASESADVLLSAVAYLQRGC